MRTSYKEDAVLEFYNTDKIVQGRQPLIHPLLGPECDERTIRMLSDSMLMENFWDDE